MKMQILIQDLCCEAIIGILPQERVTPQKVCIQAKLQYTYIPNKKESYIDYAKVAQCFMQCLQNGKYGLVEEALIDIAKECFLTFPHTIALTLYIEKPNILPYCKVGVRKKFVATDFLQHDI